MSPDRRDTIAQGGAVGNFGHSFEQASHNGELAHAVEAGAITRDDVTQLGDVLAGTAPGRQSKDDITIFDSTGLAIQTWPSRSRRWSAPMS